MHRNYKKNKKIIKKQPYGNKVQKEMMCCGIKM